MVGGVGKFGIFDFLVILFCFLFINIVFCGIVWLEKDENAEIMRNKIRKKKGLVWKKEENRREKGFWFLLKFDVFCRCFLLKKW